MTIRRYAAALLVPAALSMHCTPGAPPNATPPATGSDPIAAASTPSAPETDETVRALQEGRFSAAAELASTALGQNPSNGRAAAVRALARYQVAGEALRDVIDEWEADGDASFDRTRKGFVDFHHALGDVIADLETVAKDDAFSLELCLACWKHDWNHSGEIDERDRLLFQVEIDHEGKAYPPDDPRRKPTFRLDVGDAHWALAMMSLQRGVIDILLAYRWRDMLRTLREGPTFTLRLESKERVVAAKRSFLSAIAHAEASRRAYLAETDDDREWVPNPRQKSHPLPLPVDDALYETWGAVLVDANDLLEGSEGLDVAEIAQLGDRQWPDPPGGFIDVASMLDHPQDITLDLRKLDDFERKHTRALATDLLKTTLGRHYVAKMKPTELLGRLRRMRDEVDRGEDSLERKLRYFLWLN